MLKKNEKMSDVFPKSYEEEFQNIIVNTQGLVWRDRYDALAVFALRVAKKLDAIKEK